VPRVSIIVPTRNRAEKLQRCIASFQRINTSIDWELIIVDNGSNDGTAELLASLHVANCKIVREPRKGSALARNAGIKHAAGEILAFTDDDCYVTENYIDALCNAFDRDASVGFIGGRILLFDRTDLPVTINEGVDYRRFNKMTFLPAGVVQGANMAFRRSALNAIGNFDESFATISGFDVVACACALWKGIVGANDPSVVVFHHHGRKNQQQFRARTRFYDFGRGSYYAKFILRSDSRSAYVTGWSTSFVTRYQSASSFKERLSAIHALGWELVGFVAYALRRSHFP
jgi:glycosyltransferase involved in cell wall biosynthesis